MSSTNKLKPKNNNLHTNSMKRRSHKKKERTSSNTTKKKQKKINLKELWNKFDSIKEDHETPAVECVYVNEEYEEKSTFCVNCGSIIRITEEGFSACSNEKCGVLFKDVLDEGAEWRFYGANDTKGDNPTRCGMPVNPLLKESSLGCKVGYGYNASYEMKKIRR